MNNDERLAAIRAMLERIKTAAPSITDDFECRLEIEKGCYGIVRHVEAMSAENGFLRGEIVALRRELGETRQRAEAKEASDGVR